MRINNPDVGHRDIKLSARINTLLAHPLKYKGVFYVC